MMASWIPALFSIILFSKSSTADFFENFVIQKLLHIRYRTAYKFLRDVIFEVFVVNWPSVKFSSSKFHWQNLGCYTRVLLIRNEHEIHKFSKGW